MLIGDRKLGCPGQLAMRCLTRARRVVSVRVVPKKKSDRQNKDDLRGRTPESWLCVDCGVNTAPGLLNRLEMEKAVKTAEAAAKLAGHNDWSVPLRVNDWSEVYTVRDGVWRAAGMEPMGGCLCIGCLEKRLGRRLKPKDFDRDHVFNARDFPGTERLLNRRRGSDE
jgi:hypothetical protein